MSQKTESLAEMFRIEQQEHEHEFVSKIAEGIDKILLKTLEYADETDKSWEIKDLMESFTMAMNCKMALHQSYGQYDIEIEEEGQDDE